MIHRLLTLLLLVGLASSSRIAGAESAPAEARNEAAQRFDRGLKLFEAQDNAGALAEFRRAFELVPHPRVQYNIGLVYAALGRPVEATDALTLALRAPEVLTAQQRAHAVQTLSEQSARVARITLTTVPDGARVELDGLDVGKTPLAGPLRVASGTHVVGAILEEHAPTRKELTVAGNSDVALTLSLVATEGAKLAHLGLKSNIAGALIRIDGQRVAKTPLDSSLALSPGHHEIEVTREGYRTAHKAVDLGPGTIGEVSLDLDVDKFAIERTGTTLALRLSEPDAEIWVDGARLGPYRAPLRLAPGPHQLRVERPGFFSAERQLDLSASSRVEKVVRLDPTPETREALASSVRVRRTWGIVTLASGAALAGAGAVFLAVNAGLEDTAQTEVDALKDSTGAVKCDVAGDQGEAEDPKACNARFLSAKDAFDSAKARDVFGWVGVGVGSALAVTGAVLLLTGDSAHKYDAPPHLGSGLSGRFRFVANATGASAWLDGTF